MVLVEWFEWWVLLRMLVEAEEGERGILWVSSSAFPVQGWGRG